MTQTDPGRRFIVDRLRCRACRFTQKHEPNRPSTWVDNGIPPPGTRSYRVNVGSPIEDVDWRVFPELRCRCRLAHELKVASTRVDALDRFARHAGGVLENMWVSYSLTPEKDELGALVKEYHRLFPAVDGGLEF